MEPPNDAPQVTVTTSDEGDGVRVVAVGEIDLVASPEFRQALSVAISRARDVDVDLTEVSFMDSSGLCALLEAKEQAYAAGVGFSVSAASRQVEGLFVHAGVAVDLGWPTYSHREADGTTR